MDSNIITELLVSYKFDIDFFQRFQYVDVDVYDNRYHIYVNNIAFCATQNKGFVKFKASGYKCDKCDFRSSDPKIKCTTCEQNIGMILPPNPTIIAYHIHACDEVKLMDNKLYVIKDNTTFVQSTHNGRKCFRKLCVRCHERNISTSAKNHCKSCSSVKETSRRTKVTSRRTKVTLKRKTRRYKAVGLRPRATSAPPAITDLVAIEPTEAMTTELGRAHSVVIEPSVITGPLGEAEPILLKRRIYALSSDDVDLESPLMETKIQPYIATEAYSVDDLCMDFSKKQRL